MHEATKSLVERYYEAYNIQDLEALEALLADDVIFDVNRGQRESGKEAFVRCMRRNNSCYQEHIFDIEIMTNDDGSRVAAEFTVMGIYMGGNEALGEEPPMDLNYRLPGGAFFEVEDGQIVRVSANYNPQTLLAGQMAQVLPRVA